MSLIANRIPIASDRFKNSTIISHLFWKSEYFTTISYVQSNLKLQHAHHSPGKARVFELLKIGSFKFPPSCQNSVHMPYPIVGFVSQMPLLKNNNNCRWLLSCLIELVYKHTNTSCDPSHDDAIYKNTTLILKLLKMT